MKEKHFFAGSNTSHGFFSYFDHILKTDEAKHIYILKGGPGVGKSTFMKKFAQEMLKKGYSAEFVHCSSDNESLDGVVIPELKISLIDGTAPHTVDPSIPGAVDEIINLGIYLDQSSLEKHRAQIMQLIKSTSRLYKSAYRYLEAAGIIWEEINSIYDQYMNQDEFNSMVNKAKEMLFQDTPQSIKKGKMRKLFSESYTSVGYVNYTPSLSSGRIIWAVVGEDTNYTSLFLNAIAEEASDKGMNTECFFRPLDPTRLQHLFIPEKNLFIMSAETSMSIHYDEVFDMHLIMDTESIKTRISEIENNLHMHDILVKNALEKLAASKKAHELLEIFYVNSMNFNGADECFNSVISKHT
nr:P-loop NTPase fold protein [Sedimentibacter sp.]